MLIEVPPEQYDAQVYEETDLLLEQLRYYRPVEKGGNCVNQSQISTCKISASYSIL